MPQRQLGSRSETSTEMTSAPQIGSVKSRFQCGADHPVQSFCGACGTPLQLEAYIDQRARRQVGEIVRESEAKSNRVRSPI